MALDLAVLANLSSTDPRGYGFRQWITVSHGGTRPNEDGTQYQDVVDLWNTVRDGSNPPVNPTADGGQADGVITIRKGEILSKDIWEAIVIADMTAIPANPTAIQLSTERRQLAWLSGLANIPTVRLLNTDGTNGPVIANLQAMFPSGSGTRTRLLALATRVGSYTEEKFGEGLVLSAWDLVRAFGEG